MFRQGAKVGDDTMKLFQIVLAILVSNYFYVFAEELFALDFPGSEEQVKTADIQVNLKIGLSMVKVRNRRQSKEKATMKLF
jgi:hypothetical protein